MVDFLICLKKKSKVELQGGGKLTEEQKKIIEDGNKKRISDAANMEIEYEPGTIPSTTRNITVPSKSSATTPVATTPTLSKKVIRLEENGTNDYYEVDVDSNGKPIFNTKVKLSDTQKKDYSNKYYFNEPPTVTSNPTLNAPASVTVTPKVTSTSIVKETKTPVKTTNVASKKPITYNEDIKTFQVAYNAAHNNENGFIPLEEDGKLGTLTTAAIQDTEAYIKNPAAFNKKFPTLTKTALKDSLKTATDSSLINKMFKDSLGVTIDTAKLQKPAPKKIVTIVPPSLNQSDSSYDKSETASVTRQVGKKDINKGDKLLNVQPDTWDRWIDRAQNDIGAVSLGASLTGVGTPIAKAVDWTSTGLDAAQFAAATYRGDKPEMLNQGIQTGARIVLPIVGRAAGTIARKTLPAAEEIGYRIGKSKVGEKIIAPIFNKDSMSKYNTVGVQVIDDMQKVPGYMSRIDNDIVKAGIAAKEFMKKVNKKTNPAEAAQAKSALKRYEDALLASNKKDITEMEAMRREVAGQKFNKGAASKQATYKQASANKAVEEAKIPKLKTDGLGTEWKWQGEDTAKLIAEQEALLVKARTLPEVKRINEQLKKLYMSKVIHLKPIKVPSVKKQFGGYYFM